MMALTGSYVAVQSQSSQVKMTIQQDIDQAHQLSIQQAQNTSDLAAVMSSMSPGIQACFQGTAAPGSCAQYDNKPPADSPFPSISNSTSLASLGHPATTSTTGYSQGGDSYGHGFGGAGVVITTTTTVATSGTSSSAQEIAADTCVGKTCNITSKLTWKYRCSADKCLYAEFYVKTPGAPLTNGGGGGSAAFIFNQRTNVFKLPGSVLYSRQTQTQTNMDMSCMSATGGLLTGIDFASATASCTTILPKSCAQTAPIRGIASNFAMDSTTCKTPDSISCDTGTNYGVQNLGVFQSESSCNNAPTGLVALGSPLDLSAPSGGTTTTTASGATTTTTASGANCHIYSCAGANPACSIDSIGDGSGWYNVASAAACNTLAHSIPSCSCSNTFSGGSTTTTTAAGPSSFSVPVDLCGCANSAGRFAKNYLISWTAPTTCVVTSGGSLVGSTGTSRTINISRCNPNGDQIDVACVNGSATWSATSVGTPGLGPAIICN